ncbi:MAG: M20/M25/M40 family metallo-hydrolase [Clostridiales Family XIII bacterium]|jgi:endoglucanase|nr:M20/M25/M40 family metallo-hydrolase [Clostridiales Family XIII bacterium]
MKTIDRERAIRLLTEFNAVNGVSGDEGRVADLLEKYLAPITDEISRDVIGNIVFVKNGRDPDVRVMLSAHMDEIGFMVSDIDDKGYVSLVPVGYHIANILVNQNITIRTDRGDVPGVIGAGKPIHELLTDPKGSKPFEWSDIRVDVGAKSAEEASALGVRPGDFANMEKESRVLNGKLFSGKAVDNRAGLVCMLLAMELIADEVPGAQIHACGTVQEEIGLKGAEVLVRGVKPDYAICIDGGIGSISGELDDKARRFYLGKGPGIELYDWCTDTCAGNIVPKQMVRALEAAAEKEGVPYQYSIMIDGGTDACAIMYGNHGVLTGGISLPMKNLHTTIGLVDIDDVTNGAVLLARYLLDLDVTR